MQYQKGITSPAEKLDDQFPFQFPCERSLNSKYWISANLTQNTSLEHAITKKIANRIQQNFPFTMETVTSYSYSKLLL